MNEKGASSVLTSVMKRKSRSPLILLLVAGLLQMSLAATDLPTLRPPDGVTSPGDRVRFLFNHNLWRAKDGQPLAIQDEDEILDFLRTADVVSYKRIGIGINGILKVTLEKDGVRMRAGYRNVSVARPPSSRSGIVNRRYFRDEATFEVAAYRLSRMLGLNAVPPTVRRKLFNSSGTLQLWVENSMMEKERVEKRIGPRSASQRAFQMQNMRVFDALIENEDRNLGNLLWDGDWRLWMIDHTRAFRMNKVPTGLRLVQGCDRYLFERLKDLEEEEVREQLDGLLTGWQVEAMFERRAELVNHLEGLLDTRGEERVLY